MSTFRPGQVLRLQSGNAYRLIRRAGDGAEATVWVARGEPGGEQRALKLVESVDAAAFARLVRECQAPEHPNVVRFFEADRVDDCGILVMEFCDGGSLRRSARELRRAGDPARRRAILQQVAHGLGAVHASGLVHRDVKPENLLLAGTAVKLGDFGIAADRGSAAAAAGTDAYRAPEVRAGAAPDPVGDVFAFGLVALFLFDGRDPLPSDHPAARDVLEQRLAALHQVDPWLGDIVDLCLDEPALRYRNAAQLAEDLDLVAAGSPPQLRADRDGLTDLPTALPSGAVAVASPPAVAPGREAVVAPQRVVATVEYDHAIDAERPCIASLRELLAERLDAAALARFPGMDPAFRDGAERFRRFDLVFDGARASLRIWPFQGNGLRWLDRKPVAFVYSALTRQTTTELQRRRHEFTYDIEATADVFADRATIEVLLTNCRREVLAIAVEVRAAGAGAAANGE